MPLIDLLIGIVKAITILTLVGTVISVIAWCAYFDLFSYF